MNQSLDNEIVEKEKPTRSSATGKIAFAIQNHLTTGEIAELRRVSADEPYSPALWKLLLFYVPEEWTSGKDQDKKEKRWAALCMAIARAPELHNPHIPLGKALAAAGWSELRFVRLMRARGTDIFKDVRRIADYLNSKSQPLNFRQVLDLLLDQEGEWAEKHRRRISRDYYRELYSQKHSE